MKGITASEAGLAISSAYALTVMVQYGVRKSAELENQMTSVERVIEYGDLPSEADRESSQGGLYSKHSILASKEQQFFSLDKKPPPEWPQEGNIKFDQMSLRYSKSDLPVLKNITCLINSKEKVVFK